MRLAALMLVVAASAMAQSLPPSPWESIHEVAPKFVGPPLPLAGSNQPPIAVISVDVAPQPPVYAVEAGLNKLVHCNITLDGLGNVLITHAVKGGKVYQVQFRVYSEGTGWSGWCCAYNDYIPAVDGSTGYTFPIMMEPARMFRVMSDE